MGAASKHRIPNMAYLPKDGAFSFLDGHPEGYLSSRSDYVCVVSPFA